MLAFKCTGRKWRKRRSYSSTCKMSKICIDHRSTICCYSNGNYNKSYLTHNKQIKMPANSSQYIKASNAVRVDDVWERKNICIYCPSQKMDHNFWCYLVNEWIFDFITVRRLFDINGITDGHFFARLFGFCIIWCPLCDRVELCLLFLNSFTQICLVVRVYREFWR